MVMDVLVMMMTMRLRCAGRSLATDVVCMCICMRNPTYTSLCPRLGLRTGNGAPLVSLIARRRKRHNSKARCGPSKSTRKREPPRRRKASAWEYRKASICEYRKASACEYRKAWEYRTASACEPCSIFLLPAKRWRRLRSGRVPPKHHHHY